MKRVLYSLAVCIGIAGFGTSLYSCDPMDGKDNTETPDGDGGNEDGGDDGGEDGGDKPEEPKTYYYQEVTASLADWSGDYIITYTDNEEINVFDSWDPYGQSKNNLIGEVTENGIPAEKADNYKAIVTKDGSGYSIYVSGVGYIGYSGGNNSLSCNTESVTNPATDIWYISYSDVIHLSPASASERELQWNQSAPRFACYKSGQKALTLYRRTESDGKPGGGDENPDTPGDGGEDGGEGGEGNENEQVPGINLGGNKNGYLQNWEVPYADVNLTKDEFCSKIVNESPGDYKAYICDTKSDRQLVVTHTYKDNGKVIRNYTMLFDADKKVAVWTSYGMHKSYWRDTDVGRTKTWRYDPAIPEDWQCVTVSGDYHKGHQVASNDRQANKAANYQTFYYSNQTPQYQTQYNDGVWNVLEQRIQNSAPTGRDTMYVVTGPHYKGTASTVTDEAGKKIPLPCGHWKCVMKCSFDSNGTMTAAQGIGYWFPKNAAYPNDSYTNYTKTIDEIESLTGFDLFANVPEELQNAAENKNTTLF